jgi:ketosteroid isomerase-like protein
MYHTIIKRIVRQNFHNVSLGNFDAVVAGCVPNFRHRFAGEHTFGGERQSAAGFRAWLERVARLSPKFYFDVHDITVEGWPWHTKAVVRWTKHDLHPNGQVTQHWGIHFIVIKWFRGVSIDVYPDTAAVQNEVNALAAAGVAEALAAPITY